MTTLAYFLLGCAAASRAAAVRLEASRRGGPLAFYALDTHLDTVPSSLRRAARRTWLQVAREVGDDYRFFGYKTETAALDPEDEADFVTVPAKDYYSTSLFVRQFRVIAFAFRWALDHTPATYIVKADHDTFLCAGHLHYEFEQRRYPRQRFFMGDFWHAKGFGCRADENFLVYTRDVVDLALTHYMTDAVTVNGKPKNWALTWGLLMRYLWSRGELTVADEAQRFDSQQDWHDEEDANLSAGVPPPQAPQAPRLELVHPDPEAIPGGYCRRKLGMHVINKDTRVFDAIMAQGDRAAEYEATPALAAPLCMANCTGQAWTECF